MTDAHDLSGHAARHRPWPLCRHCCGIALDMGSARTRVWLAGKGRVVDVPTVTFPGTGAVHPVQRGTIIDVPGCSRMLQRLLVHRLPRCTRPMVIVNTPVLDGVAYRTRARAAVEVLRPRTVLTVPSARSIALTADADLSRPLVVVDIGAHLTEVVLLCDGAVTDAHRTAVGTSDLDVTHTPEQLVEAVVAMLTALRRHDRTSLTAEALRRGLLLAGGGALRPDLTHPLTTRLEARLRIVPAPHTAAVRGAARFLQAAHSHPSASAALPPGVRPH
ncbi:rod shape-determining protein MreB [Streptomyces sp. Ag82_O1-12]|uniref:rod shape-determining protein n=1 Tax=unclassified Streptomyces TaxID=2593676 RepID=UPI000BD78174|nr:MULTISPECIES: rod shape-determining protein [unclassified Streptomyces]SMQ13920.1 rod shape-determining protein MreB [Streptomyces sp. Ag82_O1-12]SOD42949.1 rod shape-determining protein MreB [Streptomyces sp. Ag82_G6-1]